MQLQRHVQNTQNPRATRKQLETDQNHVKAESEHQSVMLCSAWWVLRELYWSDFQHVTITSTACMPSAFWVMQFTYSAHNTRSSKHRPNFTGAEVEVPLQNIDVSILFHYGYIHAIKFSPYLFIHCHLQCLCSAFIYFRTSRCIVESWL